MTPPTAPARTYELLAGYADALAARFMAVASATIAVAFMREAGNPEPALGLAVVALAVAAALLPDTHLGLVVVAVIAAGWTITVENSLSGWAIGAAASVGTFHTALAAASVAPPGAVWSQAMRRRWLRRGCLVTTFGVGTWSIARAAEAVRVQQSALLVTMALLIVAVGGVWSVRVEEADEHEVDEEPLGPVLPLGQIAVFEVGADDRDDG